MTEEPRAPPRNLGSSTKGATVMRARERSRRCCVSLAALTALAIPTVPCVAGNAGGPPGEPSVRTIVGGLSGPIPARRVRFDALDVAVGPDDTVYVLARLSTLSGRLAVLHLDRR